MIDLFPETIDRSCHGATWSAGNWQMRNFHGWLQAREGIHGKWQFQVPWFASDNRTCSVYRVGADGQPVAQDGVPIDRQNRITIEGRKYGRSHWDH